MTVSLTGPESSGNKVWNPYTFSLSGGAQLDALYLTFTVEDEGELIDNETMNGLGGFVYQQELTKRTENADGSVTYRVILIYDPEQDAPVLPADAFALNLRTADAGEGTISVRLDGASYAYDGSGAMAGTIDPNKSAVSTDVTWSIYDVNGDGQVDVGDISMVRGYYQVAEGDEEWPAASACDFDGNGAVDLEDLIILGKAVLDAESPGDGA